MKGVLLFLSSDSSKYLRTIYPIELQIILILLTVRSALTHFSRDNWYMLADA